MVESGRVRGDVSLCFSMLKQLRGLPITCISYKVHGRLQDSRTWEN